MFLPILLAAYKGFIGEDTLISIKVDWGLEELLECLGHMFVVFVLLVIKT